MIAVRSPRARRTRSTNLIKLKSLGKNSISNIKESSVAKTHKKTVKAVTRTTKKIAVRRNTELDPALQIEALRHRAKAVKELKIDYIASPDFGKRTLEKTILAESAASAAAGEIGHEPTAMPAYIAGLYDTGLLGKDEETHLFRQMNYLKFRADRLRKKLSSTQPDAELIDRIQRLLVKSDRVKARIIQANLRLVVSIAKKFVDPANGFDELVSDGNLSLIRAVEKFNYSLGNRFSTYATYAIRRNYFRTVIRGRKIRSRFMSDEEGLQSVPEQSSAVGLSDAQFNQLKSSFGRMLGKLNEREQKIIRLRFGFGADQPKTFKELGQELGVCKERIRQIQARAMDKLRKFAGDERLLQNFEDHLPND